MKKLNVNHKNYALFDYTHYFDRKKNSIPRPDKLKYDLGDVVYIKEQNSIGVVLGCIDHETKELRTDMDDMQAFSQIEPANKKHFKLKDVRYTEKLYDDIFGVKYTSDENNYEVKCGKITIAKSYLNVSGSARRYEVKIFQGMDRIKTIEKICIDCPEFAKENEINKYYYPHLFCATKKK